jgi:hypothetical protein
LKIYNKIFYFITTLLWDVRFFLRDDSSQFGEQSFLLKELGVDFKKCGYIDIGAHTPIKCSNSYFLYRLGNAGIAVDAIDSFKLHWRIWRPRDSFSSFVVVDSHSNEMEFMKFYQADRNRELVSTASENQKILWQNQGVHFTTRYVRTTTMVELLKDYYNKFNAAPEIVFLDVEGLDEMLVQELDDVDQRNLLPRYVFFETLKNSESHLNLKRFVFKAEFVPAQADHARSVLYEMV